MDRNHPIVVSCLSQEMTRLHPRTDIVSNRCGLYREIRSDRIQRRWDDNKNKTCTFEGGGPWGQRGKLSKNAVFEGNATTIKSLKVQILSSRNVVVIAQAPKNCSSHLLL